MQADLLRSLMPRSDRMDCLQEFLRETVWQYLRAYTIIMAITFVQLAIHDIAYHCDDPKQQQQPRAARCIPASQQDDPPWDKDGAAADQWEQVKQGDDCGNRASAVQQAAVDGSAHLVGWAAGLAAQLPMLLLAAVFTIVISMDEAFSPRWVRAERRSAAGRSSVAIAAPNRKGSSQKKTYRIQCSLPQTTIRWGGSCAP